MRCHDICHVLQFHVWHFQSTRLKWSSHIRDHPPIAISSSNNGMDRYRGISSDNLRHPRSDAYSAEQVLLNKQQIWGGGACLNCYPICNSCRGFRYWQRSNLPADSATTEPGVVRMVLEDATFEAASAAADAKPCCRLRRRGPPTLSSPAVVDPSTPSVCDDDDDIVSWPPGTHPPPTRQHSISAVLRNIIENRTAADAWPHTNAVFFGDSVTVTSLL